MGLASIISPLMAGLAILKHMRNLSDEVLCERWLENPYYQLLCGEKFFCHTRPFDRSSMTRWRQRMGGANKGSAKHSLVEGWRRGGEAGRSVAGEPAPRHPHGGSEAGGLHPGHCRYTVQPKAISLATDAKLLHRARERLVTLAQKHGVALLPSHVRVGKFALIRHQRCPSTGIPSATPTEP